jgi:TolB-like protein/Tfp pilus assembly protein PilF
MTNSGTVDQVQAALAAFLEEKTTLAELEAVLGAALQSGLWTPALLMDVLRNAVAAGRVPPDMLRRLGLSETSDATVARVEPSSESVASAGGQHVPHEPIATGRLVAGRYRLERKLGEGGMGVVYLASDQEVKGETFAIKVLAPEIRERPEALDLLREEVRKTRSLAHPNIVGVYSLNVDRSDVFILMECLEGKTLQALLDEDFGRGIPLDRAWPIIKDLGAALAHAHDHSVIHGDLKPANVFVTTSGKAKLLDFGIARAARGSRRGKDAAALAALSPAYASCEMFEYLPPDTRDDIYALAIIIYEMLSGRHPFGGRTAIEARDAGEKPTPIASLTERQNAALAQGLAFDRTARTATVETLLAGLAPRVDSGKRRVVTSGVVVLAVVSALTIAYFVADKFWFAKHVTAQQPTPSTANVISDKSIAVLPFVDMSEKKDQEYFSDGLSEELINLLTKVSELRVPARTSSFFFKGKSEDIASIAQKLRVAHVLEGSVRVSGHTVRVSAELIQADNGYDVWSQTYDRDLKDIFQVQDEIAGAVVQALKATLFAAPVNGDRTTNVDAYSLLLQGRFLIARGTNVDVRQAVNVLQRAVTSDPTYVAAWIELARVYTYLASYLDPTPDQDEPLARTAALKALSLDPGSAAAHLALADVRASYDHDWKAAAAELESAHHADPNTADDLAFFIFGCTAGSCYDQAIRDASSAIDRDPVNAVAYLDRAWIRYCGGQLEGAEADIRRALELSPNLASGRFTLTLILIARQELDEVLSVAVAEAGDEYRRAALALAYQALGRRMEADAALQDLLAQDTEDGPEQIAQVYALRGDKAAALDWLERDDRMHLGGIVNLRVEPLFKSLRREPRYLALMHKLGVAD